MIRRPPRSTLFPTRRSSDLWWSPMTDSAMLISTQAPTMPSVTLSNRSEEHTSELQSRLHLVCRLLLEKKKKCSHRHVNHNYRIYVPPNSATKHLHSVIPHSD